MFLVFYQLSNRLEPLENPTKLWSFDQLDWQGEAAHEYFPAAGFRMNNGLCVGLLTDSGYRNQWTRIVRRDAKPVKPAPARIPDANLYTGSSPQERSKGNFFVQQTLGEVTQQVSVEHPAQAVLLPEIPAWKKLRNAALEERDGAAVAPSERALNVESPGGTAKIEVRGLQVRPVATRLEPSPRLEMDRTAEKTVFIFADETVPDTLRGYRLASQLHLADGLDFKGGDTEKIVYADLMMLTWIAGPESFRPILGPSIWYSAAGEMYLLDSYVALHR